MFSKLIESYYSQKLYTNLAGKISQATGVLPFSLAELIIVAGTIMILWKLVRFMTTKFPRPLSLTVLAYSILKAVTGIIIIYVLFIFLWGLNYYRLPFSQLTALEVKTGIDSELESLCAYLIEQANELREMVAEDDLGLMTVSSIDDVLLRAELGYENAAQRYPLLAGSYGLPKKVFLSKAMSYLGIWGVYFPYTSEANVNVAIPKSQLPAIVCHEKAHQRGFAREDEANYIAYLTCKYHPDPDFKYSGKLLALTHCMNALQRHNPESAALLKTKYSPGLVRDLTELKQYSLRHQGFLEELSTKINHYYLKANNQKEGIKSYGRMVELLLAKYRQELQIYQYLSEQRKIVDDIG